MPEHPQGFTNLSARTKLRLTGSDRERYLNGQITNDVRKATAEAALYACVTTAKGKMEADIFVSQTPDGEGYLVDGPASLREALLTRLDRYLIADDAEWADVTDDYQLFHVLGNQPQTEIERGWIRSANRFGVVGRDIIAPSESALAESLGTQLHPDALLELRIRQGIAEWGAELDSTVLPQEANLEERAIDFEKGCYIGQEVISRIKSVGKVNRRLVTLAAPEGEAAPLEPDMELRAEGKIVGQLTSVVFSSSLGRFLALGFAKRDFADPGTTLEADAAKNNLSSILEIRETPLT